MFSLCNKLITLGRLFLQLLSILYVKHWYVCISDHYKSILAHLLKLHFLSVTDFVYQISFQSYPYNDPTHLAQKRDPWNRLNGKCTLASARREVYHHDPQAPRDSLDFVLKSQYDHHSEFWKPKNETLTQPETKGIENG